MRTPKTRRPRPSKKFVNRNRLTTLVLGMMAMVSLSGCGAVTSKLACPALVPYSAETERAAADEIERGTAPILARFADDYGKLRAECRAVDQAAR